MQDIWKCLAILFPASAFATIPGDHGKGDAVEKNSKDDLIDGCPFVILQDSPSDVFYFLPGCSVRRVVRFRLSLSPQKIPNVLHRISYTPQACIPNITHPLSLSLSVVPPSLNEISRRINHLTMSLPPPSTDLSLSAWDEQELRFKFYPVLHRRAHLQK